VVTNENAVAEATAVPRSPETYSLLIARIVVWRRAMVGFRLAAAGAVVEAFSAEDLVGLVERVLFTSDFLLVAIGVFLDSRI
jgi:hypothetical protein